MKTQGGRQRAEGKRVIAGWVIAMLTSVGAAAQTDTKLPAPEEYTGTR